MPKFVDTITYIDSSGRERTINNLPYEFVTNFLIAQFKFTYAYYGESGNCEGTALFINPNFSSLSTSYELLSKMAANKFLLLTCHGISPRVSTTAYSGDRTIMDIQSINGTFSTKILSQSGDGTIGSSPSYSASATTKSYLWTKAISFL